MSSKRQRLKGECDRHEKLMISWKVERVQSHLEEWKNVGANLWALGVNQHGLQLRWRNGKPPPQVRVPRNRQMTSELGPVAEEQLAKGLWRPVNPEDKIKWIS